MAELTIAEFKEAIQGKGLDDVAKDIRNAIGFDMYRESVIKGKTDTNKQLQLLGMLHGFVDDKFHAMVSSVSLDTMFALLDQKLRAEILQNTEEK